MPGHKLNEMADAFNIKFSHHNAEDDAYVCAEVFLHILDDFNIKTVNDFKKHFDILPSKVFPGCDEQKAKKGAKSKCK